MKIHLPLENMQTKVYENSMMNVIENEKTYVERLKGYLQKITDHCYGLIRDFFFNQKAIEDIQEEYGYTTRHNAINQKHKCIKQIRKLKKQEEKRIKTVS